MNEIDELIEKLTESVEQDKFLDKDLEKYIRESRLVHFLYALPT